MLGTEPRKELQKKITELRTLPAAPAVLQPLLQMLRQPPDKLELKKVVEMVQMEKTIAAQCLRVSNSPLFGRARPAESIAAAVITLGIQRIEDILLTSCFQQILQPNKWVTQPIDFWRHSLGCALVCKEFSERIDYGDADRAYLAGLLHDIGIIVNSVTYEREYGEVFAEAKSAGAPLDEIERSHLGFTHAESGGMLAKAWQMPELVVEAIEFHHDVENSPRENPLVEMVHLVDLLCRLRGLGYGYDEWRAVELTADPAWARLAKYCPRLGSMDLIRFTFDMDTFAERVKATVDEVYRREEPGAAS